MWRRWLRRHDEDYADETGWDENKIYNVGAYWSYNGDHNIIVKNTNYGDTTYDFWKVPITTLILETLHELKSEK